jgi:RimJ/RimL family protein N-acetyltransferase
MIRETQRLVLREFRESDLDALHEMMNDAVYQTYEGKFSTREETLKRLQTMISWARDEPRVKHQLAVTVRPDDRMVGLIKLSENFHEVEEWEIGWGIDRSCWGHGYASEAALAMMSYAFEDLKINRVVAFCHADNRASVRVMEKLGMQREGHLRETRWLNGKRCDEYVYAILRSDYLKNTGKA